MGSTGENAAEEIEDPSSIPWNPSMEILQYPKWLQLQAFTIQSFVALNVF